MPSKTAGQVAYEAYARAFPGEASRLAHPWERLPKPIQATWAAVAAALGRTY